MSDTQKDKDIFAASRVKELRRKGLFEASIGYGERYLEENPRAVRVMCGVAASYLLLKNNAAAKRWLLRASQIEPDNKVVNDLLGRCAVAEGNWQEARRRFESILAADPLDAPALLGLGNIGLTQHIPKLMLKAMDGLSQLPISRTQTAKNLDTMRTYAVSSRSLGIIRKYNNILAETRAMALAQGIDLPDKFGAPLSESIPPPRREYRGQGH